MTIITIIIIINKTKTMLICKSEWKVIELNEKQKTMKKATKNKL